MGTPPSARDAIAPPIEVRPRQPHRFWRPAILALGVAISAAVAGVVHDMLGEEAAAQREVARQSLAAGLQSHIDRQLGFVRFLRGLYDSSDFVSAEEFRRFVQIDPGVREHAWWISVAWAPRHAGAAAVTGAAPQGAFAGDDIFPITYLEPTQNDQARIVDAATDAADRAAMLQAAATLHLTISAPRSSVMNGHRTTVVKAFMPVFQSDGAAPGTPEGFLIETIALDGFFDSFLGSAFADTKLSVRIYDGTTPIFARGDRHDAVMPTHLTLADRDWTLEVDGAGGSVEAGFWLPALIFATGIALTALLYLRLQRADSEYQRITDEVGRATSALADSNHRLVERSIKLEEAADDLRRTSREAQFANAAKTMFLANMSHELRTPLNAVIGFSEMIAGRVLGEQSPRYFEYARDIGESGRYLLSIIEDLLDMSRIELGKIQLKEETIVLADLVGDVVKFVSLRAQEKSLQIRCLGLEAMPRITADPKAMRQTLINLLTNAVKFSHPGAPIEIKGEIESGGGVALSVTDRGIGIAQEDLAHIFEPFWQNEAHRKRNKDGVGLGLALTQRLIQAHDGTVEIKSREGEGTTVTIHLPGTRIVRSRSHLSVVAGGGSAA